MLTGRESTKMTDPFRPNARLDELDGRAATQIMGWIPSNAPFLEGVYRFKDSIQTARVHWHPTSDIAQAWEVFQKILSDNSVTTAAVATFDKERNRWYAEVRIKEVGQHSLYVNGIDSAPEAIVRACLKFQEWKDAQAP